MSTPRYFQFLIDLCFFFSRIVHLFLSTEMSTVWKLEVLSEMHAGLGSIHSTKRK